MILCEQDLRDFGFEFSLDLVGQIAARLTNRDIELVVLDEKAMKTLNFEQRGVNKPTDVLSFPLVDICENLSQGVNFWGENGGENLSENKILGENACENLQNCAEFLGENLQNYAEFLGENSQNGLQGVNFSSENSQKLPLGSIVINANAVFAEAKRLGHSEEAEFALLFLHGLLHLLGYNHEKDKGEMREKERELIAKFKLPKSLIIRNEL